MAERRMFTKKVTDDENFLHLSASAQALYLHLSMSADDDGFSNQISVSMFKAHASIQDLEALLEKRYLYQFDNGVIVIKHWRMANALRKDRYTPTAFQEELAKLQVKDNGSYTWLPGGCRMVAERLPDGIPMVSTGKDSIGKVSIGKDSIGKTTSSSSWKAEVAQVVEAWNSLGLSQVKKIVPGSDRDKQLKKRISDYGIDEVLRAIENVRASEFLKGGGEKGWTIQFDWFISPNNFAKVLEGNYAKSREKKNELDQKLDAIRRWADEHE